MIKKLTGLTASLAALASVTQAEVKINDYIGIEGYAVGSGAVFDLKGVPTTESLGDSGNWGLDSVFVGLVGTYGDFGAKASLFYVPTSAGGDITEPLDLYITYTTGPVTVTAGKYLSYLGYESYHPAYMNQLTWAFASGIPGYHSGVKVDFAVSDTLTLGVSVTDSLFPGPGATIADEGDSDWGDGLGYELVATYTGIEKLTVFLGFGYDGDDSNLNPTDYSIDFWASYALTDKLTIAGEVSYADDASTSYILFAQYAFTEKFSGVFRWSFQEVDGKAGAPNEYGTYLTVSPTYTFNDNFKIRAEVSYADDAAVSPIGGKGYFYGIQGVFTF